MTAARRWLVFAASVPLLASCSRKFEDAVDALSVAGPGYDPAKSLPFYLAADLTPKWPAADKARSPLLHRIERFRFTDQRGETVTDATFAGKIYVADFFFTTCGGICPTLTRNLRAVQDEFLDDGEVLLISHTVMPEIDTVAALRAYGEACGVRPGKWFLVTGRRESIYSLARESYFAEGDLDAPRGSDRFLHTEKVFLVDKARRIRGVYDGTQAIDIRLLTEDIRALKEEYRCDGSR